METFKGIESGNKKNINTSTNNIELRETCNNSREKKSGNELRSN